MVDAHRPNRPNNNEKILGVTVVVGEQTRIPTRIRQTIATILVRQEAVVVAVAGTVMMEETKMKMHTDNRWEVTIREWVIANLFVKNS